MRSLVAAGSNCRLQEGRRDLYDAESLAAWPLSPVSFRCVLEIAALLTLCSALVFLEKHHVITGPTETAH